MTSRNVGGQSFTLNYDAENRLVSVTGAATASFSYDADGKQVIGTVNGVTTYYVGNHYEVKNDVVTKYYFAGATRLAVRTGGTLSFLLADHIGSSSVTTDANGGYSAQALYKAFGESRFTDGTLGTDYKFTGQRSEAALGIYWFQSRWYDGQLGRFTQPDTIVPTQTQGTQAWDRYAFVNNNPVRYNDPTGHQIEEDKGGQKGHLADEETDEDPYCALAQTGNPTCKGAFLNHEEVGGLAEALDANADSLNDLAFWGLVAAGGLLFLGVGLAAFGFIAITGAAFAAIATASALIGIVAGLAAGEANRSSTLLAN